MYNYYTRKMWILCIWHVIIATSKFDVFHWATYQIKVRATYRIKVMVYTFFFFFTLRFLVPGHHLLNLNPSLDRNRFMVGSSLVTPSTTHPQEHRKHTTRVILKMWGRYRQQVWQRSKAGNRDGPGEQMTLAHHSSVVITDSLHVSDLYRCFKLWSISLQWWIKSDT